MKIGKLCKTASFHRMFPIKLFFPPNCWRRSRIGLNALANIAIPTSHKLWEKENFPNQRFMEMRTFKVIMSFRIFNKLFSTQSRGRFMTKYLQNSLYEKKYDVSNNKRDISETRFYFMPQYPFPIWVRRDDVMAIGHCDGHNTATAS